MMKNFSESGQAILEVLLALAIGIIIATAFVSLGAVSVRNSTFSKDQVTATQLAQEGIEAMITIRDQDTPGAIQSMGAVDHWTALFNPPSPINTCAPAGNLTTSGCSDFYLLEASCSIGTLPASQRCIKRRLISYTSSLWKLTGNYDQFARIIRITDTAVTEVKDVTVFVWWTDVNGIHTSTLTRKLHKNKLE